MTTKDLNYYMAGALLIVTGLLYLYKMFFAGLEVSTPNLLLFTMIFWNTQQLFQIKEELS